MDLRDEFIGSIKSIPDGKKIYFASDFHLGVPDQKSSKERERKLVNWLDTISHDAHAIFLVGDIFDFWFEYKYTIPKGFIRFQGKLATLKDSGIHICFFTGNHDMWLFDYFPKELGIPIFYDPIDMEINNKTLHIGHGDGLGPGDGFYKFLKSIFSNKFFQWLFNWFHPNIGMWVANTWSMRSRINNNGKPGEFKGDNEWLVSYSNALENNKHRDYYIFGHRHLPLEIPIGESSTYFNLGEWVFRSTYLSFDGNKAELLSFNN